MPLLMGILNLTPDSFSDGGRFFTIQAAVDQARRIEDDGADILDLGGESTRPYSQSISLDEEMGRVVPVLERLQGKVQIPISIDTTKAGVASAAIDLGAEIINDVSGLEADPAMIELACSSKVGVCAMHMRGTPQTMQEDPVYVDVVSEILDYLERRDHWLVEQGVAPERICLDPGIGFAKTVDQNWPILKHLDVREELGLPILMGASRKKFLGELLAKDGVPRDSDERESATTAISTLMAARGIWAVRVHDVKSTSDAVAVVDRIAKTS